jgi:hypothetical protein
MVDLMTMTFNFKLNQTKHDTFFVDNTDTFKIKMLNWSNQFNIFCFLDNNTYHFQQPEFDCILAAGEYNSIYLQKEFAYKEITDIVRTVLLRVLLVEALLAGDTQKINGNFTTGDLIDLFNE